ncbi:hypothetical protein BJ508DRAFT_37441 [Ascobolus immersus RN42]|uniref:DNA (cytosine-5-)-methyltransferase n=1 Tax=Ascobolus immersus RN42 TaxID=1160509 RepID=A0A3N4II47_ASCIM|nr:hypothetical protein BJ508DRAFT_37441 [Ascobolus immersus RN42]
MRDVDDPIEDSEADDEPVQFFRLGEEEKSDGSEVESPYDDDDDDDVIEVRQGAATQVTVVEDDEDEDDEPPSSPHLRSPKRKGAKKVKATALEDKEGEEVTGVDPDDLDGFIVPDDEEEVVEKTAEGKKSAIKIIYKNDTEEKRMRRKRALKGVMPIGLRNPRSKYDGWTPPYPIEKEYKIVHECGVTRDDGYQYITLEDFEIYTPGSNGSGGKSRKAFEFVGLNFLTNQDFCIDAVVRGQDGKAAYFLHGVHFSRLSVGNYCNSSAPCVGDSIWIQTKVAAANDTWYQLGRPSNSYAEFHTNFVWIANLTKYFIDYISDDNEERAKHDYKLADFEKSFHEWLEQVYGTYPEYRQWKAQYPSTDFRQAIIANHPYIFRQVYGLEEEEYRQYYIWKEVQHTEYEMHGSKDRRTVVTPLVHKIFEPAFGRYLNCVQKKLPKGHVLKSPEIVIAKPERLPRDESGTILDHGFDPRDVKVGSLIGILPDKETKWKSDIGLWYAYVHEIIPHKTDPMRDRINVVWLYQPDQTILQGADYPYKDELFFSDHCNCNDAALRREEIVQTFSVAFFCGPGVSGAEFFIRQKFVTATGSFVTMHEKDLKECGCEWNSDSFLTAMCKHKVNDTVLVEPRAFGKRKGDQYKFLEPAIIVAFLEETRTVQVRRFYRRKRDLKSKKFSDSKPNQLVLSDEVVEIKPKNIVRGCRVRCYAPDEKVPAPYSYGGTGDCFFVTESLVGTKLLPYPEFEPPFTLGYDLSKPIGDQKPMAGMDLYCGGGNFGRGLEEGGAVQNKWAVDYEAFAVHTYSKNMLHDTAVYYGSVNDFLKAGLTGNYETGGKKNPYVVPKPGEVDFISAGSPCQGFSNANQKKFNETSMYNASLVASVASYVDFYRPKYALLENVLGIASQRTHAIEDGSTISYNVYSMILTAIIAMGYQTQMFLMDAWSHGAPQSRVRMFLEITAPGFALPKVPPRSHSHPAGVKSYALKEAPNGGRYAARELQGLTPFPYVTIAEACAGLPRLGDTNVGSCVPFPDHRSPRYEDREKRMLMRCIPKYAAANSMVDAVRLGYLPESLQLYKHVARKQQAGCKSWKRVHGDQIVRTITTALQPSCAFTGQWIHWDEHRLLTVMEARRAQGFPDHEVLNASAADGFMICGNSVARQVAVALGICLREAWITPITPRDAVKRFPGPPMRRICAVPEQLMITNAEEETEEMEEDQEEEIEEMEEDQEEKIREATPPPQLRQAIVNVPKTPSQRPTPKGKPTSITSSAKRTTTVLTQEDDDEVQIISETQASQVSRPSTHKRKRSSLPGTQVPGPQPEQQPASKKRSRPAKAPRTDSQASSSIIVASTPAASVASTPATGKKPRGRPKSSATKPSSTPSSSVLTPRKQKTPRSSLFSGKERPIMIGDDSPEPEGTPLAPSTIPGTMTQGSAQLSERNLAVFASPRRNRTPDSLVSEEVKSTEIVGVDEDGIELW